MNELVRQGIQRCNSSNSKRARASCCLSSHLDDRLGGVVAVGALKLLPRNRPDVRGAKFKPVGAGGQLHDTSLMAIAMALILSHAECLSPEARERKINSDAGE
jgi:hypothetical protein